MLTSICFTKFRNLRNRFCEDEMEAIIMEDKNPTQFWTLPQYSGRIRKLSLYVYCILTVLQLKPGFKFGQFKTSYLSMKKCDDWRLSRRNKYWDLVRFYEMRPKYTWIVCVNLKNLMIRFQSLLTQTIVTYTYESAKQLVLTAHFSINWNFS